MTKYQTVIGLELHCALKTNSKVFSPSRNSYNEVPNDNVNEIDLSFPGIMPSLNKEAVRKALKMSMILGCKQPDELLFDRKNYYYPDLPKGFQITQITKPVGIEGKVLLYANGKEFNVEIHDIHLEEDTASLDHYDYYSLIDYNRAGVPLIEIVTTPCLHSAEEAVAFLEFLANTFKYCDISEADTKKGQIRCDVNINLKDENGNYITPKVEIKNINSFAYVAEAIKYEVTRQIKAYENNSDELVQETRRYDDDSKTTISMRKKEDSVDYKYFVEPNIPRIKLEKSYLEEIAKEIPVLPNERLIKYIKEYNLSENEAKILVKDINLSNYFDSCINLGINPKTAFNWISSQIIGYLNKENISINDIYLTPNRLKSIVDKINNGEISSKQAKELFVKVLEENEDINVLIDKYGMKQLTNNDEIEQIINNILDNNQNLIEEYHNGRSNIFDFFVGMVMKETRGQASPVIVKQILTEKLK
jgi:aspartyl-tRNA(Asn)/glutamyl-tRNA(Gln) amidotransferase subunit B